MNDEQNVQLSHEDEQALDRAWENVSRNWSQIRKQGREARERRAEEKRRRREGRSRHPFDREGGQQPESGAVDYARPADADEKTPAERERALAADLIVLPKGITGTRCENCRFFEATEGNEGRCLEPRVRQTVTTRHCCAFWDSDGVERYVRPDAPVPYNETPEHVSGTSSTAEGGGASVTHPEHAEHAATWKAQGVKAPRFKSWFGDWESAPHLASRVVKPVTNEPTENLPIPGTGSRAVDAQGHPVVVYHGSQAEFHHFDPARDKGQNLYGKGFYFTEDPEVAGGSWHEGQDWRRFKTQEEAKAAQKNAPGMLRYIDPYQHHATGDWMAAVGYKKQLKKPGYAQKDIPQVREPEKRNLIAAELRRELAERGPGYLTTTERGYADRAINEFENGRKNDPYAGTEHDIQGNMTSLQELLGGQPYNVSVMGAAHDAGVNIKGHTYPVYLNIRKPFEIDGYMDPSPLREAMAKVARNRTAAQDFQIKNGLFTLSPSEIQEKAEAFVNGIAGPAGSTMSGDDLFTNLQSTFGNTNTANAVLREAGYDGITHEGGARTGGKSHRVWIAFEPHQIKHAENRGTFDPNEPNIYYARADTADRVEAAAAEVHPDPTLPQVNAQNYRQGHITINGIPITIETAKGGIRKGKDHNGEKWQRKMHCHYGRIKGTCGSDAEQFDVYLGPDPHSETVFVVDQLKHDGKTFDEHKGMLGWHTLKAARKAYLKHIPADRLGGITPMTLPEFKAFLEHGNKKKPVAGQKRVLERYARDVDALHAGQELDPLTLKHVIEFLRQRGFNLPGSRELAASLRQLLEARPDLRRHVSTHDLSVLESMPPPEGYTRAETPVAYAGTEPGFHVGGGEPAAKPAPSPKTVPPVPVLSKTVPPPYAAGISPATAPMHPSPGGGGAAEWHEPIHPSTDLSGHIWHQRPADSSNRTYEILPPGSSPLDIPAYFGKHPRHFHHDTAQPGQVATEVAANRLMRSLGVRVPGMVGMDRNGEPHLVSRYIPGGMTMYERLGGRGPTDPLAISDLRRANSPQDLARLRLAEYLLGAQDRHTAQYVVGPDGKIIGVDYGMSGHPHEDTSMIPLKPNALTNTSSYRLDAPDLLPSHQPLDRALLQEIVDNPAEANRFMETLAPHYGANAPALRDSMRARLARLGELARHPDPRVGHLEEQPDPGWLTRGGDPVVYGREGMERYDDPDAKWRTIGGHPEGGKEHVGGRPIKMDAAGNILGGSVPREWQGKNVREIPRKKGAEHGLAGEPAAGGGQPGGGVTSAGGEVASETGRSGGQEGSAGGAVAGESAGEATPGHVPARVEEVNRRLDRYEQLFRSRGNHKVADWMRDLRDHINTVGVESALEALGGEVKGAGEKIQYGGHNLDGNHDAHFIEQYLDRAGISLIEGTEPTGERRAISTVSSSSDTEGLRSRGQAEDVFPSLQTLRDKLDEAKHLPGLEASEDLSVLMGGEMGGKVPNFTPEVLQRLDERYGEGKWIVKSYGDEAYAGYGIFFPQRVAQLQQDARNALWASGQELAKYGFTHLRDEAGKVVGIKHRGGNEYRFGTEKYTNTIHGEARTWGDRAETAAASERGAAIPEGRFMAQPAFPVVGVSNEERARGVTFKRGQEGRVHIVTRNGRAEIVPHSTWLKEEPMPVVFENNDTRDMAKAAVDAINALPMSERQGQLYAPDIVRTADGFRVVEANPANEAGASGYLQDNPLIIDSYVSHLTGREPAHVRFIRKLLGARKRGGNRAGGYNAGQEGATT